ncbi:MAG: BatA domain-containing protein [Dokdonella sp.]|uniref:BatA domain-containing protein n=1 Tax=Dokdonella sp. TaxID=2291710 RepID=UPI002B95C278|nr:BatA domain-containing protein [Xanthomonadales bacterium]HQX64721.1 BatA domain-containing protein [Dokdonella sp.]HQY54577.1 BatA domain-containing protein [Dokdonella sp.]
MSLALLLPLGLIALAGLIVPLLIHLVRQSDHPLIDFPALRWLRESERPRRRLRFEDRWLLLVRLLLVALAAVLLAQPILKGSWRAPRHLIAVVPGVDLDAAHRRIAAAPAEWHWLASGFPAIDEAPPAGAPSLSSLLRELDAELADADALSVVVPDEMHGLDAQRIRLGRAIEWIVVPSPVQEESPRTPVEYTLALRHQTPDDAGLRVIRAALASRDATDAVRWNIDDQAASAALPLQTDTVIWLGSPMPDAVRNRVGEGGRVLLVDDNAAAGAVLWRDEQGVVLASQEILGNGQLIHLRGPLTAESMPATLDADFPERLQALLQPRLPPPARAHAEVVQPRLATEALPRFAQSTDLIAWLGLLIGFLFLIERVLATRRPET